jgi:hypothetical protein
MAAVPELPAPGTARTIGVYRVRRSNDGTLEVTSSAVGRFGCPLIATAFAAAGLLAAWRTSFPTPVAFFALVVAALTWVFSTNRETLRAGQRRIEWSSHDVRRKLAGLPARRERTWTRGDLLARAVGSGRAVNLSALESAPDEGDYFEEKLLSWTGSPESTETLAAWLSSATGFRVLGEAAAKSRGDELERLRARDDERIEDADDDA